MDATLRVTKPEPEQQVFWWAEPTANLVLALPPADVDRWRIRRDIKHIQFIALHSDWVRDRRYQNLVDLSRSGECPHPPTVILTGIALTAYELCLNPERIGLGFPGIRYPDPILHRWCLDASDAPVLNLAIEAGLRLGFLVKADLDRPEVVSEYRCVVARRGAAESVARGAARRSAAESAADSSRLDVDEIGLDQTGFDDGPCESVNSVKSGPDPPGSDGDDEKGAGKKCTTATTATTANDDGDGKRGGSIRLKCGLRVPKNDPEAAYTAIGEWLTEVRKGKHLPPYPLNSADEKDLVRAVCWAVKNGTMGELLDVLHKTAGWADDGSGFKKALREAGIL